ncbi:cytochrome c oxidase assembly protein [Bacillus massilinigeriensis]|uniref:cytochrome c oxidase assembly protein n=1 Tax=Bacillus mediterraneensis TaxID=1805474 RepID=UPI0008F81DDD|nr:cytochrome c oxidase assembly protein [Bacillus mediterraneensis]
MHNHHRGATAPSIDFSTGSIVLLLPFMLVTVLYLWAVFFSKNNLGWPVHKTLLWIAGVTFVSFSVAGPLAEKAHEDFMVHMEVHLLLGMLAPLLMALAAPATVILRALSVKNARIVTRVLKSRYSRFVSDPFVAAVLNVGGLWMLYRTDLFGLMHHIPALHVIIHLHIFLSGYLFTISMVYIDPTPHRTSFYYRAGVLIVALAGHGILSKSIYASPPSGISASEAQAGGMLMYYGGDAVDILLIILLCWQWYKAARPRNATSKRSEDATLPH